VRRNAVQVVQGQPQRRRLAQRRRRRRRAKCDGGPRAERQVPSHRPHYVKNDLQELEALIASAAGDATASTVVFPSASDFVITSRPYKSHNKGGW